MESSLQLSQFYPRSAATGVNHVYDETGGEKLSGVLLHTQFLHIVEQGAAEEKLRREHFENIDLYQTYYDRLTPNPSL